MWRPAEAKDGIPTSSALQVPVVLNSHGVSPVVGLRPGNESGSRTRATRIMSSLLYPLSYLMLRAGLEPAFSTS